MRGALSKVPWPRNRDRLDARTRRFIRRRFGYARQRHIVFRSRVGRHQDNRVKPMTSSRRDRAGLFSRWPTANADTVVNAIHYPIHAAESGDEETKQLQRVAPPPEESPKGECPSPRRPARLAGDKRGVRLYSGRLLRPVPGVLALTRQTIVDCTPAWRAFGGDPGAVNQTVVIGIDFDPANLALAAIALRRRRTVRPLPEQLRGVRAVLQQAWSACRWCPGGPGVASTQIDDPARVPIANPALDMRMDPTRPARLRRGEPTQRARTRRIPRTRR